MRKIIIVMILFTSCRSQDHDVTPIPITKTTEKQAKISEVHKPVKALPVKEKIQDIDENKGIAGNTDTKRTKAKNEASITITPKATAFSKEGIDQNLNIKDPVIDNGGGASSYEEGYIPFIKQYW